MKHSNMIRRSMIEAEIRVFAQRCEDYSARLQAMETGDTATPEAIENMRGFLKTAQNERDQLIELLSSL